MREVRYEQIADALREQVTTGDLAAGRLLPSESDLGRDYAASRMTIRKALELLRDEGLVDSRQGYGWFVAAPPVAQSLARLGTIEGQLASSGRTSERRILEFRFTSARSHVRKVLGGVDRVLEVRRVQLLDGVAFARVTVWCPSRLSKHLSLADVEASTFHDLLDVELGSANQTIAADALSAADAAVLGVPAGSPALVCERVTRSVDGDPVLLSEHVFPAHLTRFEVELTSVDRSASPSGLRLLN